MSHEAQHSDTHHKPAEKPQAAGKPSFWFVIILTGLFIAAVNFVNIMGHDEGHETTNHHEEEVHTTSAGENKEAAEHNPANNPTENTEGEHTANSIEEAH